MNTGEKKVNQDENLSNVSIVRRVFGNFTKKIYPTTNETNLSLSKNLFLYSVNFLRDSLGRIKMLIPLEKIKKIKFPEEAEISGILEDLGPYYEMDIADYSSGYVFGSNNNIFRIDRGLESYEGSYEDIELAKEIYKLFGIPVLESKVISERSISNLPLGKFRSTFESDSIQKEYIDQQLVKSAVLDTFLNFSIDDFRDVMLGFDGKVHRTDFNVMSGGFNIIYELIDIKAKKSQILKNVPLSEILKQVKEILSNSDSIKNIIQSRSNQTEYGQLLIKRIQDMQVFFQLEVSRSTTYDFQKLRSLELNFNEEVLDSIVLQLRKVEDINRKKIISIASGYEISEKELINIIQTSVENAVSASDFFIATTVASLNSVLRSGRFKSQFETGSSRGTLHPELRATTESTRFGYNIDEKNDAHLRPIYGYISDNKNGIVNEEGTCPPPSNVVQYGGIAVKFKRNKVLNKTTVCFTDSLTTENEVTASPALMPHYSSVPLLFIQNKINRNMYGVTCEISTSKVSQLLNRYVEAQYHSQLFSTDIESVHLSLNNSLSSEEINDVIESINEYNKLNPNNTISIVYY